MARWFIYCIYALVSWFRRPKRFTQNYEEQIHRTADTNGDRPVITCSRLLVFAVLTGCWVLTSLRRVYVIVAFVTDWMLHFYYILWRKLLHFALHFYYMLWRKLLHFSLVLHFVAKVITFCVSIAFCVSYYILWRNSEPWFCLECVEHVSSSWRDTPGQCVLLSPSP